MDSRGNILRELEKLFRVAAIYNQLQVYISSISSAVRID